MWLFQWYFCNIVLYILKMVLAKGKWILEAADKDSYIQAFAV